MRKPFTVVILPKRPIEPPKQSPHNQIVYVEPKRDPLAIASMYVPGFDRVTMKLAGRDIKLTPLMKRTNRILKRLGKPQLDYNPEWLVP